MIYKEVELLLSNNNLNIISKDIERPWGGFYVLDESQAQSFAGLFFNNLDVSKLSLSGKLSHKILVIKPKKRLSWQYHYRRSEIWSVIKGSIKVIKSDDDVEKDEFILNDGDQIEIKKEEYCLSEEQEKAFKEIVKNDNLFIINISNPSP